MKNCLKTLILLLSHLLVCVSLIAGEPQREVIYPLLTGPLLSPFGYVIEKGHVNFEPYLYGNTAYGLFDRQWNGHSQIKAYNITVQPYLWYGFANRWDIQIGPQFSWNYTSGASHWVINDMPIELEFQILYERPNRWQPAIKLALLTTVPFGKYQKLHFKDNRTDIGGLGNWQPGAEVCFQKILHLFKEHYLVAHYSLSYTIPTAVKVKGYNAYGGGLHTSGKVFPGSSLLTILGFEYSLTKHWALALDIQYLHQSHTRFKGHKQYTNKDLPRMSNHSSEQLSLAPAIEYDWNKYLGVVGGVWFSLVGRNSPEFVTGIIAINLYK